ncbi:alpha/beta hydrolase [Algoriphagus sp.]|uniref:alpha/beta hydrolase n=1 Tax=Algoriphagus sp. TaxID=1872435 RepID=UPI00328F4527
MNGVFQKTSLIAVVALFLLSCDRSTDAFPDEATAIDLLDQPYGANPRQKMDVYLPAGRSQKDTPLLIYIHGGAWIEGSKEEFNEFRSALSTALPEYAFASINYSLFNLNTGANKFPTQENEIKEAITYIQSKSLEWNISDTIILAGASAGGHLALLHAYKHASIGNIKAVVAFFSPTDLAELYDFNFLTVAGLRGLLGGNPSENPTAYAESSPITFVDEQAVPTIFFHGTVDQVVPISQSELLAIALSEAGVPHEFIKVPNQGHGFTPETYSALFQQAAHFLAEFLN